MTARPVDADQPGRLSAFSRADGREERLPLKASGDRAQGRQQQPGRALSRLFTDDDRQAETGVVPRVGAATWRQRDDDRGGQGKAADVRTGIHSTQSPWSSMVANRCTSSRDCKVLLSCWISEELRMELDRVWAARGLSPHGRTQKGMEEMIAAYLAAQQEC